ncbi:hypothetical protein EYF80_002785 [Liparis tanakae]|uniref:Uncharacterized protein n=1 Tax=Liparis tanakae TaxID=230148 RepID=A0A4Z2JA91_9TELE|nr:hypothetical protein EYF80_002785 [Liparis tanakae]
MQHQRQAGLTCLSAFQVQRAATTRGAACCAVCMESDHIKTGRLTIKVGRKHPGVNLISVTEHAWQRGLESEHPTKCKSRAILKGQARLHRRHSHHLQRKQEDGGKIGGLAEVLAHNVADKVPHGFAGSIGGSWNH